MKIGKPCCHLQNHNYKGWTRGGGIWECPPLNSFHFPHPSLHSHSSSLSHNFSPHTSCFISTSFQLWQFKLSFCFISSHTSSHFFSFHFLTKFDFFSYFFFFFFFFFFLWRKKIGRGTRQGKGVLKETPSHDKALDMKKFL